MPSQKSSMMFTSLVMMFSSQAMMALGKMINPISGKIERELPQAQMMIDLLEMIQERTQGNLSDDEARLLEGVLRDLRLNYVAEVNKETNPASPAADAPAVEQSESGVPDNVA